MRMSRHKENGNYSQRSSGGSRSKGMNGHAGALLAIAALIAFIFAALDEWMTRRRKKLEATRRAENDKEIS